ncbi:hypothetical protein G9A89_007247 [Geosiphon pyriformis]|nr:hypothetical protein G9A89_007247 [Geosiphon pyriformis]
MKFTGSLAFLASSLALVSAHSSMMNPLPRGHPLNPNAATKDFACITAPYNGGAGCPVKPFPCGGYQPDTKVTQVYKAGEIIDVKFWNPNFPNALTAADADRDQARHNGGLCEFSLSYDGGVTYTVIATYHRTCPDIFFSWKVKIPENAPTCDKPGKCIFSWSWINALGNREFYQNCADVKIVGKSTKPLPIIDITRVNLPPKFPTIISPTGDSANRGNEKGSGPLQSDVDANMGLKIVGSGKGDSTSPAPTTTASTTTAPTTTQTPSKPTTGKKPKSGKKKKSKNTKKPSSATTSKPDPSNVTPLKPASPSTTTSSNGSSCSQQGQMTCKDSGNDPIFYTCDNGKNVERHCPSSTACHADGTTVLCK